MVRKIASQVPATVSRLLQSTLLNTPPVWYQPVLANPPPILPPRQVTARNRPEAGKQYQDLAVHQSDARREGRTRTHHAKQLREPKLKPQPIVYEADRVRRQFFADFPFEALRPVSLVESREIAQEHPIRGAEWTSLAQRGAFPTVEDTVAFTINLHEQQALSMTDAYRKATAEFVALRGAHELSTLVAAAEARHYGATFKRDEWTRTFDYEQRQLDEGVEGSSTGPARTTFKYRKPKVWSSTINPDAIPRGEFSAGRDYAAKWRLPAPVMFDNATSEGDLLTALMAETNASEAKAEDGEMDDLDFMNSLVTNDAELVSEDVKPRQPGA